MGLGLSGDAPVNLPQQVPGGQSRVGAQVQLLNWRQVPAGAHHDIDDPVMVTAVSRLATGAEVVDTLALEWTRALVRGRVIDHRVMTSAVWLPVGGVGRRHA